MGLIRKTSSLITLGAINFRSNSEKTARNTKKTVKELKKQTELMEKQAEKR